jgi:hypothetical protein
MKISTYQKNVFEVDRLITYDRCVDQAELCPCIYNYQCNVEMPMLRNKVWVYHDIIPIIRTNSVAL